MGWFDGWFGSGGADGDPLRKLDPKLREFLEKESPVKYYKPERTAPPPPETRPTLAADPGAEAPAPTEKPVVPPQSLYEDGRYAHLWKTYRPQAAIDAETKSDHERLMDVVDGYKDRKIQIGKAALENCALEQENWRDCMNSGSVADRFTMCRDKVKQFERCYNQQARLLKALGYLSAYDRRPEVDEKIQMHADKLYHRMLEQEAAVEKAKKEGLPPPQFESLFASASPDVADPANMKPEAQKQWKARLDKVAEEDRAAEEEAMKAELRAKVEMAERVQGIWHEQAKERESRKAEGQETVIDRIAGWLGGQKK